MRNDTYICGEHYFIMFEGGRSVVKREGYLTNDVMFRGKYEDCINWLNNKVLENMDYDLRL